MAAPKKYDLSGTSGSSTFRELPEGLNIRLADGALAQITGNPGDGTYLLVNIVEDASNPARVGQGAVVHFFDVKAVES